ncbi:Rha family transcriptional regulator [Pseudomonas petrae]|uniref:Rha family transcriptional regulator n=1 Tax=Pseudomonas petrae TaxID=2912190 RepID=A0ABS9I4E7_9PSED|nr:Rha family transcriptional regulator [Pseudomonas petrae]MCF7533785.1 Rha family transcriptional regulator [Pseudomonas petrae]MCF7538332.1 Rha family transcriptional regulator [Pseudomonas petrae]MCF7542252.1 Rha family transcriptional regulator [Pseudomonas petrae]MCF7555697.1 Rha family transcriptional regulator [Pseudomonas petrae]
MHPKAGTRSSTGSGTILTSLDIVDMINKERAALFANGQAKKYTELRHDHFMGKVVQTLGESQSPKFLGDYIDDRNRTQKCYVFPKREATLMAMSYSPAISAAVYDKMTALEEELACVWAAKVAISEAI